MKTQKNKKQYKMNVGENIRAWRELKQIKQDDLAHKIGISTTALSNIETNKSTPDIHRLEEIADALEVEVNQLLLSPQQIINITNNAPQSNGIVYGNPSQSNVNNEILSRLTLVMEKITSYFTHNSK